jgi:hypothetical protein
MKNVVFIFVEARSAARRVERVAGTNRGKKECGESEANNPLGAAVWQAF